MPEFDTSHVKNIVLLGHAGAGKTTLAECMLFEAGLINRRGNIAESGIDCGDVLRPEVVLWRVIFRQFPEVLFHHW